MTHLFLRYPVIQSVKMELATSGSTALNGSSSNTISESEYKALAKLILAFCPPEMLVPLSPMTVSSPLLKIWTSLVKHAYLMASSSLY